MKKAYPIILIVFSVFWVSFVLLDYFQKHPRYSYNLFYFQYWDLFLLVLAYATGGGLLYQFAKNKVREFIRGGILILPGIFLVGCTFAFALNRGTPKAANLGEVFHVLGNYFQVALQIFFIILSSYSIGHWILQKCKLKLKPASLSVVSIATGIMATVMAAFVLGAVKGLYWFTIGPVLLAFIGINHKESLAFVKRIGLQKIKPSKQLNFIGVSSFLLLLFLVQLNLLQNISPFPKGWDSLSLYVKIPTIINDYHGLVRGYQPYNWSLLMSLGMILFNSLETVLALSFVGGVLCLSAMYAIGKDVLKMNQNYILLGLLIFYLLPTVAFQSFQEQKVDLGLLFTVLSIVLILFHWIKYTKESISTDENAFTKFNIKSLLNPYLVLMGLLTGFAFGIKLTTLFTYFCIICIMWFVEFGFIGFAGAAMLCCFAILLVRLDDMSGMRAYHLSSNILQWVLLLIGLSSFAFLLFKSKKSFLRATTFSVIYTLFFGLMAAPWITKNYIDSNMKLSFRYLLNGKTNEPPAGLNYMKRKYEQHLKKGQNEN